MPRKASRAWSAAGVWTALTASANAPSMISRRSRWVHRAEHRVVRVRHTHRQGRCHRLRSPSAHAPGGMPGAGRQPEGERRPLFLVHPLAGVVFPYYELALQLGPDQPVYGLQSIGIAGEALPLTRIESMAEHYLAAIRQVQPEGPYQLAGWSFGGTIALEMAQQLQRKGESVDFLGIIDTRIYSTRFATLWHGSRVFLTSMVPHLGPYVSDYLGTQSNLSHPKQAEGQSSRFLSKLLALFQTAEPGSPNSKTPEFKRLLQVFHANVQADSRYRPQRYSGRVTLFKTAAEHPDSTWGWGDVAAKGVELHQIPGHHMNVLRPPQVQILAEKLLACLAQTDEVITPYPRNSLTPPSSAAISG